MKIALINHTPTWDAPGDWEEIRDQVLGFLDSGSLVTRGIEPSPDRHDPAAPPRVPVGFRTDGEWLWALGNAFYVRTYDQPIDPDLLEHIRAKGYHAAEVGRDVIGEALRVLEEAAKKYVAEEKLTKNP